MRSFKKPENRTTSKPERNNHFPTWETLLTSIRELNILYFNNRELLFFKCMLTVFLKIYKERNEQIILFSRKKTEIKKS